jgi:hypothetical protein
MARPTDVVNLVDASVDPLGAGNRRMLAACSTAETKLVKVETAAAGAIDHKVSRTIRRRVETTRSRAFSPSSRHRSPPVRRR